MVFYQLAAHEEENLTPKAAFYLLSLSRVAWFSFLMRQLEEERRSQSLSFSSKKMPKEDISGEVNNSSGFFIRDNYRFSLLYNFPYNFQSWGLGLNDNLSYQHSNSQEVVCSLSGMIQLFSIRLLCVL